jgi:PKHD-type hydroxylase
LQLKYSYWYFQSVITPEICQKIIDAGNAKIVEAKKNNVPVDGYTFGENSKLDMPNAMPKGEKTTQEIKQKDASEVYVRDSEVAWFTDPWLYDLIHPYIHDANRLAGWKWNWDYSEPFQFTKYNEGGFYGWHKDGGGCHNTAFKRFIPGISKEPMRSNDRMPDGYTNNAKTVGKIRKLSMTLSLNPATEYEGGDLKFDFGPHNGEQFHTCSEIHPQGSIIVFPSFVDHCVTPVTKVLLKFVARL